jgi:hypothetical protein
MTSTKLYVIGNGFDRYHGVASAYSAFGESVRVRHPELFSTLERYFVFDDNWNGLEDTLALTFPPQMSRGSIGGFRSGVTPEEVLWQAKAGNGTRTSRS